MKLASLKCSMPERVFARMHPGSLKAGPADQRSRPVLSSLPTAKLGTEKKRCQAPLEEKHI